MMTYQEIKDRLSKCEFTLKAIKNGKLKEKDNTTVKKLEMLKESLQTQLLEQEKGMVVTKDAGEAEKLAKKGVNVKLTTEAPGDYHYVKVARRDYKKAIGIIMKELGGDYVELNDPDTIYFKNLDQATLVDAVMDLQANDIDILDTSIDVFGEAADINDPVLMKLRALQSKISKKKRDKFAGQDPKAGSMIKGRGFDPIILKLKAKRAQVMRDMEQEAEPEGGPIADKYGDMLNKIDAAIAKAKGQKVSEVKDEDLDYTPGVTLYRPGTIAPKDLYYSDKHGKLVAMDDVDDKYHDRLELVYRKGDKIEGPMDENKDISSEHLRVLASKAGKAVVKAVHDSGDEVARAKIKDVYASALSGDSSPEAFTVHIIYKNDSEVSYRFQIIDNTLYLLADNEDIKISDIGFKPSGEPFINTELVKNEMSKYFKQMREMTDQEFADAKEADRLANHPEKDKLIAIQNLIAKEKALKEVELDKKDYDADQAQKDDEEDYERGYDDDGLPLGEAEYAADKYNVNVFGYQTRYFKICPGAKSFMDRVIAQQNDKENKDEIIRLAKLHDLLFMHEIQALKDPAYAAKVLDKAEYIVKTIKDDVDTLGLDVAEVDYLDSHIEKIKDAASKEVNEESELDKITKAKRLIKQQAPAMNKLPQDDPKRKAFIDKVKQINKKHKELLAKQDDKISAIGKDQELDEKEDIVKSHPDEIEDATFPVAEAFKKVGIDMSKDVHVKYMDGGPPGLGGSQYKDLGTQSPEKVIKMLEAKRLKEIEQYKEDLKDAGYELEYPIMYEYFYYAGEKFMPKTEDGVKEFKLTFSKFEGESYDIFQESNKLDEGRKEDEDLVHELIGDLFAPGNARLHFEMPVKKIASYLKRYSDGISSKAVKAAMDTYDKLAADGTLDKEVKDGDGFISSKHVPKLKKAFELIGLYNDVNELDEGRGDMDMIKGIIKDRANESGFTEREEAAEVIGGIADEYMISLESLKDYIDEGESDLFENKLEEATDLYDRNGIQITRFSGGNRGLMLQINIGGKYIVVPADEFNNFIRALASIKDDVKDMKLQQPRDRYEEGDIAHDCANHVLHEKYGHGICLEEQHTLVKEGDKHVVTHYDVFFKEGSKTVKDIPVSELKIVTESHHGHKRRKK